MRAVRSIRGRPVPAVFVAGALGAAIALPLLINGGGRTWISADFQGGLYHAARSVLHGLSPFYGNGYVEHLAAVMRTGKGSLIAFSVPVYPPPVVLAVVPFALLPVMVASTLWLMVLIAAILLALRWLGVRDVRCVAIVFLSIPVLHALILGSLDPLFMLGAAAVWRWREKAVRSALAAAALIAAKLFAWPLVLWMILRRRMRAAALTVAITTAAIFVSWAIIGFAGLSDYPRLLSDLTSLEQLTGVSLVAVLHVAGIAPGPAHLVALATAIGLLMASVKVRRLADGEERAFGLAVVAALVASPIVWTHYLTILFVPIAVLSPSFSPLWLLPLITYAAPQLRTHEHLAAMLPYLVVEAVLVVRICWGGSERRAAGRAAVAAARPAIAVEPPAPMAISRPV